MLGEMVKFVNGKAVVMESWNGNTLLKTLVATGRLKFTPKLKGIYLRKKSGRVI